MWLDSGSNVAPLWFDLVLDVELQSNFAFVQNGGQDNDYVFAPSNYCKKKEEQFSNLYIIYEIPLARV